MLKRELGSTLTGQSHPSTNVSFEIAPFHSNMPFVGANWDRRAEGRTVRAERREPQKLCLKVVTVLGLQPG